MKIVKKLLIGIAGIIALIMLVAAFVKKDFAVEREVVINKPRAEVYNYLKMLKNQDNWSVWAKMDPNMKKTYRGTDGTVGFVSAWEGNSDVGSGEQEIKAMQENTRIDYELRFIKPWESTSPVYMTLEDAAAGSTKLKWAISGKMTYPTNIMMLFMDMDAALGKDFADGLNNLKALLNK
jgi:uncharacterized protein YndB with AHSA1/START domain